VNRRILAAALPVAAAAFGVAPAHAEGPEQLEQLEPGRGAWQAELFGTYGRQQTQVAGALYGVSDRLALGVEAEAARADGPLRLDTLGLAALLRLRDPEARPIGVGVALQAAFGRGARLAEVEGRVIVEHRSGRWWLQGDVIARHAREPEASGTGIAYAGSAQHALGHSFWLGLEASGQLARIAGDPALAPAGQHYLGPSLTMERSAGRGGIEIGLAYLYRIAGRGPGPAPRVFVQLTF